MPGRTLNGAPNRSVDTPARRARARSRGKDHDGKTQAPRRNPALSRPPHVARSDRRRQLDRLRLDIEGREYRIGHVVEGDPTTEAAIDSAATITVPVRDPDGTLTELLADEQVLLAGVARCTVAQTRYVVTGAEEDGTGLLTVTLEDEVAWRMRLFTRFLSMRRTNLGLFGFALRLVKEASAAPHSRIRFYCPELGDKQEILQPKQAGDVDVDVDARGGDRGGRYEVKGQTANATQRACINAVLSECVAQGTSRQVAIAAIMCVTQESGAGADLSTTGNDDAGYFQQGREWISLANTRDPAKACRAFLLGHEANVGGTGQVLGWKQRHGSLRTAGGDLDAMITAVQISVGGYGQWREEAERTVDEWLGNASGTVTTTSSKPYEYTRGEKNGQPESSWDALARYGEPVAVRRWAQDNTLYVVSDEELRHAAPAIEIDGTEPFLLQQPAWQWTPNRPVNECTLRVLGDLWAMRVGAVVRLSRRHGPAAGIWIVTHELGGLVSPELEVTLRRPAPKRPEPAGETREASQQVGGDSGSPVIAGAAGAMWDACKAISDQKLPYAWGGGHSRAGHPSQSTRPGETQVGYDCSGSVGAALAMAGLGGYQLGQPVPGSGTMAAQFEGGEGREFTIWANATHVFVKFANGVEFNTAGHPSESGPRVGRFGYPTGGFTARHVKGH